VAKTRTYKGFKPYLHQADVIAELKDARGTGKIVSVNSSRQKGKSYMISNLLLYFAINFARTNNYCVSPTLKQSKAIYRVIMDAIGNSGVVKSKNATDLTITLINGSTINFKSAEQRDALRGYTADFLAIDECAFIPDEIFYLVLPWTDAKKAPILMTSTPFVKGGFFFNYFNYGLEHSHNTVTINWSDPKYKESIEKILPPEKLEEYREVLPSNVFKTEYLGEFLDDDGAVFVGLKDILCDTAITATDRLYVGLDFSNQGENDYTVISIFNQNGNQVYIKYFNNISPLGQIVKIVKELEPLADQIDVISCELNSIGTPYTDLIKEKSQILEDKVEGFQTSNTSKNAIVLNMQTAIENKNVTLLPDDKEIREFGYFTATYNPKTRNVSYAAPQGLNDDTVMATLIAYDAYRNGTQIGTYNIGFSKR
jgi:thymidine kinase